MTMLCILKYNIKNNNDLVYLCVCIGNLCTAFGTYQRLKLSIFLYFGNDDVVEKYLHEYCYWCMFHGLIDPYLLVSDHRSVN